MTRVYPARVTQQMRPTWRPTAWLLVASLSSLVALYLCAEHRHPAIPLIAAVISLSYLLPYRLPRSGPTRWILRGCLVAILVLLAPERSLSHDWWYLDEAVTVLLGTLAAAELMLQHWLEQPGPRQGFMLVLAAAIFATATNTADPNLPLVLSPVFALAAICVVRVFGPQRQEAATTAPLRRAVKPRVLNVIAIVVALILGASTARTIQAVRSQLNNLGMSWLANLAPRGSVGMSSQDTLSKQFKLVPSLTRALRIHGTRSAMHLRGMVFDTYDGSGWRPRLETRKMEPLSPLLLPRPGARQIAIDRLEDNLGLVYLPLNCAGIVPPADGVVEVEAGHRTVARASTAADICTYGVALGASPDYQGPLARALTPEERQTCLAISDKIDPAVAALAAPLKRETPLKTMVGIVAYLQANHHYSLSASIGDGDPISSFLLNKNDAHCQYFASSAVILMRYCGIPSRYVTGYFAHELADDDGLVVRDRDAHAWAEAWIDGIGWMTVDATPGSGRPDYLNKDVSRWRKTREWFTDLLASVTQWFHRVNWQQLAAIGGVIVLLGMIVQNLWAMRHRVRPAPPVPYAFPGDDLQAIARDFGRWMRHTGELPLDSATWLEHLASQAAQTPARRQARTARLQAATEFVAMYNRTRFGNPTDPAAIAALRQTLERMKER